MKDFFDKSFEIFHKDWPLVTAGTMDNFNTMTIGWGGVGTLWRKPVVTVYVKPIRYTHSFLKSNDYFTVSFYDEQYRDALNFLGNHSGRDMNKVEKVGFEPIAIGESITFKQAKTTVLCRKIYEQNIDASAVPSDVVDKYYTEDAPHTMFVGEVIDIIE